VETTAGYFSMGPACDKKGLENSVRFSIKSLQKMWTKPLN